MESRVKGQRGERQAKEAGELMYISEEIPFWKL